MILCLKLNENMMKLRLMISYDEFLTNDFMIRQKIFS